MTRPVVMILSLSLLFACAGEPEATLPTPVTLVSDADGAVYSGARLSPDGTRLAWAQTAHGKSAIFVGNPDGSGRTQLTHGVWDQIPVWSPDGRWIAYHGESPDFDVLLVSPDGGEPRPLTSGPEFEAPVGWLPDGSAVLFVQGNLAEMMVAPLDGSPPHALLSQTGVRFATVSPDGTHLAYQVQTGDAEGVIWLKDLPDGEPRQVTTDGFEDLSDEQAWSPDGGRLLFQTRRTGTWDIWVLDVASGESRQLTTDIQNDLSARWSPDGRWIAFSSNRGGQQDLWVVADTGGRAMRLTNDPDVESSPRWSPDGQSLLYQFNSVASSLALLALDGAGETTVLDWPGTSIGTARLAADGSVAVFSSEQYGAASLWTVPIGGGEATPLAPAQGFNSIQPRISPDGAQVAFLSNRGGSTDLWVVPTAGGEPRRLTSDPSIEVSLEWSPDGTRIAYSSNRDSGTGQDVWIVPAAGGTPTRVTTRSRGVSDLDWGGDGGTIFFVGDRGDGGRDLYRVPAAGGTAEPLGAARGVGNLYVSPDGSQIAYISYEGGWAYLDVMPTAGGSPRRLLRKPEVWQYSRVWTPDGSALVVGDLDLEGNHDVGDAYVVTVADDAWRPLTQTLLRDETPIGVLPDGKQVLVRTLSSRNEARSVRVGGWLK